MSKVINLRTFRKQAARAEKRRDGDLAAAKHGQTRAERDLQQARSALEQARLDGHRRADRADGETEASAAPLDQPGDPSQ